MARLSPEAAAQLLILRRKARIHYADYLRYWILATNQPFKWGWHFDLLADVMEAVALRQEDVRFLNVNIPPRFAKSTLLSQQWQAWMIGRDASARSSLFSISSSAYLATRDSRRTLDTIKSEWFQAVFPGVTIGNKETEAEWEATGGAYRIACGRDGTVTGRGAHHLLVDDCVSASEANSEIIREDANRFLGESLRSRLDDQITGTITNIQQRLHEQDATGTLNALGRFPGGDQYRTIEIPNEAKGKTIVAFNDKIYKVREDKELLHPTYLDARATAAIKVAMRNDYEGQYQQNPIKMEGGHLDPRRLVKLQGTGLEIQQRLGLRPVFYMDFAATEKQTQKNDPDYTVILVGARDQLGRLIILDIWRKQTADYGVVARTHINMHKLWRPRLSKGERGGLLNLYQPALKQQQHLIGHFFGLEPLKSRTGDKIQRSMVFQGMLNAGMVAVPEAAPWLADYEHELRGFPNGGHDDQVDPSSDLALDYEALPRGDAPVVSPTDPRVIFSDEIKAKIQKLKDEMESGLAPDPDDW